MQKHFHAKEPWNLPKEILETQLQKRACQVALTHRWQKSFSFVTLGNNCHNEINWEKTRGDYLAWATTEFIEGRSSRPAAPSTAKQILGSVTRIVKTLKENGPHLFLKRKIKSSQRKVWILIVVHPGWGELLQTDNVMKYVEKLTQTGKRPAYVSAEVCKWDKGSFKWASRLKLAGAELGHFYAMDASRAKNISWQPEESFRWGDEPSWCKAVTALLGQGPPRSEESCADSAHEMQGDPSKVQWRPNCNRREGSSTAMHHCGFASAHSAHEGKAVLHTEKQGLRNKQYGFSLWCTYFATQTCADFLSIHDDRMRFIIRDQKTSRASGNYLCPVPDLLCKLLVLWSKGVRDEIGLELPTQHDHIFLNLNTGKPFDQQGFSKYSSKAFRNITGVAVNLQTIRRVFADGVFWNGEWTWTFFFGLDYLGTHHGDRHWKWLSTAMLTGEASLRKVYFRDGLQKQAYEQVPSYFVECRPNKASCSYPRLRHTYPNMLMRLLQAPRGLKVLVSLPGWTFVTCAFCRRRFFSVRKKKAESLWPRGLREGQRKSRRRAAFAGEAKYETIQQGGKYSAHAANCRSPFLNVRQIAGTIGRTERAWTSQSEQREFGLQTQCACLTDVLQNFT